MNIYSMIFSFLSFTAGTISAFIAVYLAPHRRNQNARLLMLLMIAISIWSNAYGMELISPGLLLKIWWVKIEYFGASWIGILIFCFILSITEKKPEINFTGCAILSIVPIITIVLAVTNNFHHLIWRQAWINNDLIAPAMAYVRSLWFWIFLCFSYILLSAAVIILIQSLVSAKGLLRKQLTVITIGVSFTWFLNCLYFFGFKPFKVFDMSPIAYTVMGIILTWNLLKYQMLNLIPIVHETVLDSLGDPIIALDINDQILKMNKSAESLFQIKLNTSAPGNMKLSLPKLYAAIIKYRQENLTEVKMAFNIELLQKHWNLRVSPLTSKKGRNAGNLIILKDITQRLKAQAAQKQSEKVNKALFSISNAVNTTSNLDNLFESIHKSLNQIMMLPNFYIALYNKEKDWLTFPYFIDEKDCNASNSPSKIGNVSDPLSPSSTSWVIQSGTSLLLQKEELINRVQKINKKLVGTTPEIWMGSPLKVQEKVIGAIVAQSYSDPSLYNKKHLAIFSSVSDQIALAIERKRAQDAEIENKNINKVLFSIANAVNTTDNLDELYESIHKTLDSIINVANFIIGIYDHKNDIISYPYFADETGDRYSEIQNATKSGIIALEVISNAEPFLINKNDIVDRAKKMGKSVTGCIPEQWLGIPLIIKQQVIGVMIVQSYSNPSLYSQKDIEMFLAVSDQVALAIERKRSHQALAKSNEQVESISNQIEQFSMTAASMISTKDPKDIFNKISRAIVRHSDFKKVMISYLTDKPPYREILASSGIKKKIVAEHEQAVRLPGFYDDLFKRGTAIGQFSIFIPASGFQKRQKSGMFSSEVWLQDDMLFVKMQDVAGKHIGHISVDDPLSGKRPTNETVRPLEIFSSLVSQIIINTKSREDLKIAKNAAEESAKSKSDFLANMSHEIRTPMNAIMGLTDLILKTDLKLIQKDYLEKIKSSSITLLGIINDILDFSKIDVGKLAIDSTDFNLNDVMDSLSDMFSSKTSQKDIEFIISIAKDIPINLIGDPLRLRQILINLTGNAVKFTHKGEIIVEVLLIECKKTSVKLEFTVKDTGIGIPGDRLNKLFDSFVQADGSTTRKYGGTGLGLTISKKLIELMGGKITVESKPDQGSKFKFDLTFKKKNKKTLNNILLDSKLKGMKVLVVDDNNAAREMMYEVLTCFNFKVKAVESGEKAIDELKKALKTDKPYKLVMLDMIMPGIDGIETAKTIRKNSDISDVSIIIMTGFAREELMHQANKTDIDAFLMKPIKQSVLLDTIMDVFNAKPIPLLDSEVKSLPAQNNNDDFSNKFWKLNGLNILLAEDNEINQLVAVKILEEVGIKVMVASTGSEAIEFLKNSAYDIVLMDIQMPEMDGYTATDKIRNELKLNNLPVIAMTAHAMAGDKEKCIKAGMDDYISKPIDPRALFLKLMDHVTPEMTNNLDKQSDKKADLLSNDMRDSIAGSLPDSLPGLDIKSGVARFMGNIGLYMELLESFSKDNKKAVNKINTMIKNREIKKTLNYLHTIKGASGNLSAMKLHKLSKKLETSLIKHGKADTKLLENYEKAFTEVAKSLKKIKEAYVTDNTDSIVNNESQFNPIDIKDNLNLLNEKILQNDIEALDILKVVKKMIPDTVEKKQISALDKTINDFDFDGAELILKKIANILKITLKGSRHG